MKHLEQCLGFNMICVNLWEALKISFSMKKSPTFSFVEMRPLNLSFLTGKMKLKYWNRFCFVLNWGTFSIKEKNQMYLSG